MPYADNSNEIDRANYLKIRHAIQDSKDNINFGLLNIIDYPLTLTERCNNQILLVYRNGRFEILPSGVVGARIKDYLGLRYHRIQRWTALPAAGSNDNPATGNHGTPQIMSHKGRDIYEC